MASAVAALGTAGLVWFGIAGTPADPTRSRRHAQALTMVAGLFAGLSAFSLTLASACLAAACIRLAATVWWHDGGWFDIPDRLTVPAAAAGVLLRLRYASSSNHPLWTVISPADSIHGLVVGAGLGTLLLWGGEVLFRKPALGFGDVTLLAAIGSLRGPVAAAVTIPVAAMLTLLGIGVAWLLGARRSAPDRPAPTAASERADGALLAAAALNAATDDELPADGGLPEGLTAERTTTDDPAIPPGAIPFGIALRVAALIAPAVVRVLGVP